MSQGYSVQCSCGPLFLRRKHTCFECGSVLEKKQRSVVVNSESEEAKNYDFYGIDTYLCGDVEFITIYFTCPACGTTYEIRQLVELEKKRKKGKL